ncbi:MAG: substrate-binding domain-containing protein [Corynebacterium matruchotii]|jgi:putative D-ribose-binding periplasmic protein|uniref:Sugar-binding domain protein n=3 Tax=Corynebacterium matruchotii TaxID=43768 RepID=E0DD11_9CORY|nr:substrate-binding domain-containing protein [Corynebacterium matruchotii]RKW22881.1 MAG: D-ribose ABC transporter substrate-binding protein [Corynebacterium sp.]EFM50076.1 sugar-binding domain protein [Corynebacterium matruchotii ATCC 14266]KAB1924734.1 D-ribose ABC transporter substrate-binding protein [Corynebacterium matruchotii]QIP45778.1 substrate-binding domain-containing protein [Corynebacterium matruchotii]SPW23913.1 ABC-type transporter, periplasmic component [Corynebacterium matru
MFSTKLRKTLAVVASATLLCTSLTACNRDSGGNNAAGDSANKSITFALSTQANSFMVKMREGAQKKADELGLTINFQDASDDSATQANQLANAAATGAGAVIVNPTDSDAMAPAVKQLTDAKIPVVAVDRAVNNAEVSSYIASDNVGGGKQAAKALSEAIHGEGEILVLQGKTGSSASRERGQGFDEGLKDSPNIKVVAKQTAEFERVKGLDVTTNLLQAHPNVKAIFAENDEMALGAIEALGDKAGKDVIVVGFDGVEDALKAIKEGTMYASIAQQPADMAAQAVVEASKLLKGEAATKEMQVDVVTVTKDNVDKFSG